MLLQQVCSLSRLSRVVAPTVVRSMSSVDYGDHHKSPLEVVKYHRSGINDLPVPSGSWQEYYNKQNAKYNIVLGAGFTAFIITMAIMYTQGTLYLHGPPDYKKVQINVK